MYTTTFEEPRAWAMEWDGSALVAAAQADRAPQASRQVEAVSWKRMTLPPAPPVSRNGAGVFVDPQSWALAWEGAGLADAEPRHAQRAGEAEAI